MNFSVSLNQQVSTSSVKLPTEPFLIFLTMSIVQLLFSSIGIVASIFFIVTVIHNQSIRTLSNILTCNSSLAVLILASDMFSIAVYVLYRDLSPTNVKMHNMFLCHLRAYISHVSFCALVHSYVIQAFYRLAGIVFYKRLYYQSLRPYLYAIAIQWMIAIVQVLPIAINQQQDFIEEEYLCQIAIDNSRAILYVCIVVYFIPLPLVFIQYCIIAKYSRRKDKEDHISNLQQRALRQRNLICRILILITILLVLGTPYCTIIVLDALSLVPAPSYAHRVGFLFVGIAAGSIMMMMIYFTRNLRRLLSGQRKRRRGNALRINHSQQQTRETVKRFQEIVHSETLAAGNWFT